MTYVLSLGVAWPEKGSGGSLTMSSAPSRWCQALVRIVDVDLMVLVTFPKLRQTQTLYCRHPIAASTDHGLFLLLLSSSSSSHPSWIRRITHILVASLNASSKHSLPCYNVHAVGLLMSSSYRPVRRVTDVLIVSSTSSSHHSRACRIGQILVGVVASF